MKKNKHMTKTLYIIAGCNGAGKASNPRQIIATKDEILDVQLYKKIEDYVKC